MDWSIWEYGLVDIRLWPSVYNLSSTTAHCKSSNRTSLHHAMLSPPKGTGEHFSRDTLRVTQYLLSDWRLPATNWPCIVSCTQVVINKTHMKWLDRGNGPASVRYPLEVLSRLNRKAFFVRGTTMIQSRNFQIIRWEKARVIVQLNEFHNV